MNKNLKMKMAFTLAEVLITLGIIGVVSALTIPTLVKKYQDIVFTSKFKQAYAMLNEATRLAKIDFGATAPKCGYRDGTNPYEEQGYSSQLKCDDDGKNCKWVLVKDGVVTGNTPQDYNGPTTDCGEFGQLILNRLKIAKTCKGNALRDGCVAKGGYEGTDDIAKQNNPDLSDEEIANLGGGVNYFTTTELNEKEYIFVLQNNVSIITYDVTYYKKFRPMMFALDINGPQGPNKFGYDVFAFMVVITLLLVILNMMAIVVLHWFLRGEFLHEQCLTESKRIESSNNKKNN